MDWTGVVSDVVVDLFRMSVLYIELRMVANVRKNSDSGAQMQR